MSKKTPTLDVSKIRKLHTIVKSDLLDIYMSEIVPMVTSIRDKTNPLRNPLINYLIIRSVSIIEHHFKNVVIELVDKYNLEIDKLFAKGEMIIPLASFEEIKKAEFTRGRLVASNFNFQNLKEINFVLTHLLGIAFFDTYKEFYLLEENKGSFEPGVHTLVENWTEFEEIFDLRNDIIHSMKPRKMLPVNHEYYRRISGYGIVFALSCETLCLHLLNIKMGGTDEGKSYDLLRKKITEYNKQ